LTLAWLSNECPVHAPRSRVPTRTDVRSGRRQHAQPQHHVGAEHRRDALEGLADHRASLVVIGAQVIYLHTGAIDLPLAEATKDSDLVLDPRDLLATPRCLKRP
jgi:hypothetical protein